ncbi:hypothetical protein ISN44_As07g008240 [Arabidopsis suecica]|uniref:Disease resistance protein n=1 Tax=Arabidopsis suecica TaxID=45249 RepID=A0A8T2BRZ4_ARASU|nr:hypothetical protein ISN44_As07g008240 [Arabidopsis suecica]
MVEELPASLMHCSRLKHVNIEGNGNPKTFLTHLPTSVTNVKLSGRRFLADDCIKGLHNLKRLILLCCDRLTSLPELPGSLKHLLAKNCKSLERLSGPLNTPNAQLDFTNCFKLDREARRAIIQQSFVNGGLSYLEEKFKVCVVISPNQNLLCLRLLYRCIVIGSSVNSTDMTFGLSSGVSSVCRLRTKHLFIFHADLPFTDPSEVNTKIMLQFSCRFQDLAITECGIQILPDETD